MKTKEYYLNLLEYSHKKHNEVLGINDDKKCYLSDNIFDFTTYDDDLSCEFVEKAIEICLAITSGTTFDYIKNKEAYRWFILMCNMPFFYEKLDWGGSIRGAWWGIYLDHTFEIESCGVWQNDEQVEKLILKKEEWNNFIYAMSEFVK